MELYEVEADQLLNTTYLAEIVEWEARATLVSTYFPPASHQLELLSSLSLTEKNAGPSVLRRMRIIIEGWTGSNCTNALKLPFWTCRLRELEVS